MSEYRTVYVVLWNYSDNSAFGVVGVYHTKQKADAVVTMLKQFSDGRYFSVTPVVAGEP